MIPRLVDPGREFLVACLCAQWCGTCRDYQSGFEALASQFPNAGFVWVDIEDHADAIGDIDVENFPSMLIQRQDAVLFFGTVLPDLSLLKRLIESLLSQTEAESAAYALATPERRGWQRDVNLRLLLRA